MTKRRRAQLRNGAGIFIQAAALTAMPNETGGILLGYFRSDAIVVSKAIEVTDAQATETSYTRREADAQSALIAALDALSAETGYVGDWHSHPGWAKASPQDLQAMDAAAVELGLPLALVIARVRKGRAHLVPYVVDPSRWSQRTFAFKRAPTGSQSKRAPWNR